MSWDFVGISLGWVGVHCLILNAMECDGIQSHPPDFEHPHQKVHTGGENMVIEVLRGWYLLTNFEAACWRG